MKETQCIKMYGGDSYLTQSMTQTLLGGLSQKFSATELRMSYCWGPVVSRDYKTTLFEGAVSMEAPQSARIGEDHMVPGMEPKSVLREFCASPSLISLPPLHLLLTEQSHATQMGRFVFPCMKGLCLGKVWNSVSRSQTSR